jgi:hypothetical protein
LLKGVETAIIVPGLREHHVIRPLYAAAIRFGPMHLSVDDSLSNEGVVALAEDDVELVGSSPLIKFSVVFAIDDSKLGLVKF